MVDLYRRSANQHEAGSILKAEDFPAYFEALRSGRYIDAHDALRDPRTNEFSDIYLRPLGITSMIDAALRVGGEVVGALCLEHVGPQRMWQDHEISFSGEVSDQIAHALLNRANLEAKAEQVRLQEQLFRSQKMEAVGRLAGDRPRLSQPPDRDRGTCRDPIQPQISPRSGSTRYRSSRRPNKPPNLHDNFSPSHATSSLRSQRSISSRP
ncbi:MAG: GAF domain-containing protein [Myxococcales bacterium]|nr:GAF domain-containing protein [Myxococcales bacterium]